MNSLHDQLSYLIARDPSIISYSRSKLNKYRCNLIPLMNDTEVLRTCIEEEPHSKDDFHMKIFLRLRGDVPVSPLYNVNENVFACEVPQSHVPKHLKEGDVLHKKYTFSNIFHSTVTQTEMFDIIVKPKIFDLINGHNSTLLAYGASGSGKTYTIVGTEVDPGIIPRALEYLFRSLPTLEGAPTVYATEDGLIRNMSFPEQMHAQEVKQNLTSFFDKLAKSQIHKETYKMMQQRLSEQPTATVDLEHANVAVAVWISFAEIYNEIIYDLLTPHNKNRPKLCLGKCKNTGTYIKGLMSVSVATGLEAYQIMRYGLTNLNYAATALNDHSSRSHCIFTIRLVQSCDNRAGCVSTFNFCDLAGSERLNKTNNVGDRLKESNNINTSLFVLGRCLKEVRDAQKRKHSRTIPFRDSKLTQLFQYAISGEENLSMIVNVNPSAYMFPETQHVLNFSAIAMEVKIEHKPKAVKLYVVPGDLAASQRILDLEDLVFNMQQQIEKMEEERHDDMAKYLAILRQQSADTHERWRVRSNEQAQRHRDEMDELRAQCEKHSKNNSIVEIVDSDDDEDVHAKCRMENDILKEALKRTENQLKLSHQHLQNEKRESVKFHERIIELEEQIEINDTYNESIRCLDTDDSDYSEDEKSVEETVLQGCNQEEIVT